MGVRGRGEDNGRVHSEQFCFILTLNLWCSINLMLLDSGRIQKTFANSK